MTFDKRLADLNTELNALIQLLRNMAKPITDPLLEKAKAMGYATDYIEELEEDLYFLLKHIVHIDGIGFIIPLTQEKVSNLLGKYPDRKG